MDPFGSGRQEFTYVSNTWESYDSSGIVLGMDQSQPRSIEGTVKANKVEHGNRMIYAAFPSS